LFSALPFLLLLLPVTGSGADLSRIDRYVRAEMSLNEIPGASVAVVRGNEVVYLQAFGVRSIATGEPMTVDTPVDLASLSKSFTALAVMDLAGRGRVDLATPVTRYLPELGEHYRRVTLRHLIRHTSGLTRRDDFLVPCCGQPGEFDLTIAVSRLASAKPRQGPGFAYANSNYVLLAAVAQRVSGEPFASFVRDSVFRPMGMSHTTLDPAEATKWGLAEPHERRWGKVQPVLHPFLGWYGSSLVKSTARDMARYLEVTLRSRGSLAGPYDGGWFIRRRTDLPGNPPVLEHGGDTWGGNTGAIVVPAWKMGAVVLLNIGAHRAADIARGVLARAAGHAGPPPAKASNISDADVWAMVFTASAAVMFSGLLIYVRRVWRASRHRQHTFMIRALPVIRAAALLLMAAVLIYMPVGEPPPSYRALPESLRIGLATLAAASAAVLAVAAVAGLLPRSQTSRSVRRDATAHPGNLASKQCGE
jgi:CubicO group peptidase (beta-lactamase class C family)